MDSEELIKKLISLIFLNKSNPSNFQPFLRPYNSLKNIISNDFLHKIGTIRYKWVISEYNSTLFTKLDRKERVIGMLEFLIDNTFVKFGGRNFHQGVAIHM